MSARITSMKRIALVAAPFALSLAGCVSEQLRTTSMPGAKRKQAAAGQPYYLPRGLLPVTITGGTQAPPTPAQDDAGSGDTDGAPIVPPAGGKIPDIGKPKKPKSEKPGKGDGSQTKPGKYSLTVTIGNVKYVPDVNKRYFLEYLESGFTDDTFDIKVDKNGLLQTSDAKSKDRSGDVALKFVELIGQVARIGALGSGQHINALNDIPKREVKQCQLKEFSTELLLDVRELANKAPDRNSLFPGLSIKVTTVDPTSPENVPAPEPTGNDGVIFPVQQPYEVTVAFDPSVLKATYPGCDLPRMTKQVLPLSAPGKEVFRADVSRAALVEKHVTLTVEDGVLIGTKLDKPSEVLAGISLPVELAKAIVAIPAGLLSVRVEEVKQQEGLTEAQANLLKQQIELIKQQRALEDARSGK